jgi:hypothetical protein
MRGWGTWLSLCALGTGLVLLFAVASVSPALRRQSRRVTRAKPAVAPSAQKASESKGSHGFGGKPLLVRPGTARTVNDGPSTRVLARGEPRRASTRYSHRPRGPPLEARQ